MPPRAGTPALPVWPKHLLDAQVIGPRVCLHPPQASDAREYLAASASSRRHFGRWMPVMKDRRAFMAYVERRATRRTFSFLIRRREDDALIGTVGLNDIIQSLTWSANLGYALFAGYTGQGYMTEAIDLALRFGFRSLRLHRVEAGIQPLNQPSRAVVQRLNFRLEGLAKELIRINGRWRDHERWALLAREYEPRVRGVVRASDT